MPAVGVIVGCHADVGAPGDEVGGAEDLRDAVEEGGILGGGSDGWSPEIGDAGALLFLDLGHGVVEDGEILESAISERGVGEREGSGEEAGFSVFVMQWFPPFGLHEMMPF